ncbi:biotin--[acetyl-CoA-carboxylase] ligase [Novosphingobium sp. M1R2S20]|uniref:biotin--[biotin carboxyl-carrier protein] ligase n=1 Tax=Novosphingobium rhizovicinum TaxID=3228928 RepID=A0ABV3R826_9SPHN
MIEVVAETGSTNTDLTTRVSAGEMVSEGHWLVADRQVRGRGRHGRTWSDGAGNFMGSTLIRLRAGDPPAHTLSLAAGVAVFEALCAVAPGTREQLSLKWPNDVLVGPAKLAGILLERVGEAVVVGVGVNLLHAPDVEGRAVASLASLGHVVDRDAFAATLDTAWGEVLQLWRFGGWAQVRSRWLARAHPVGTALAVHGSENGVLHGVFLGLDSEGALQLEDTGGTRRTIHAGEVLIDSR